MPYAIVSTLAFRLAIILAGTAFMYFGYRLFMRGVMPPEGTGVDGQVGDVKLTLSNAAPGTVFSLFGAVLVCVMLWSGMPEYIVTAASTDEPNQGFSEIRVRGGPGDSAVQFNLEEALSESADPRQQIAAMAERLGDSDLTLAEAKPALLGLATAYFRLARYDEAIPLVQLVYQSTGDSPETLALMALVERARGEQEAAQRAVERLREAFPSDVSLINELE